MQDAERLLARLTEQAAAEPDDDALENGVELARRRLDAACRKHEQATGKLTGGRPLYEVLWSLPDDI